MQTDTDRFDWFFGSGDQKAKYDFMAVYLKGLSERWTPDQWRAAIDQAMRAHPTTVRLTTFP